MIWEIIGNIIRSTANTAISTEHNNLPYIVAALAGFGIAGILAVLMLNKNLATRVTYIRFVVQMVAFAAFFYLFTFLFSFLYLLIIIFGMTIVLGRLYCGWFCPLGFVMDLEVMARKTFKIRHRLLPEKLNKILHQSRYIILLFLLLLPIVLWEIYPPQFRFLHFAFRMAQLFAGPFLPYGILIAPMMPFVVPWKTGAIAVFHINLSFPYVSDIVIYVGHMWQVFAIAFVGLTLASSFFIRRFWCRFCPTGASLAVLNRFKGFKWAPMLHLDKDEEKCTKCGICKRVCPMQVTDVFEQKGGKVNTSMCMLCLRCAEMCPYEGTLKVKLASKTVFKSRNWL